MMQKPDPIAAACQLGTEGVASACATSWTSVRGFAVKTMLGRRALRRAEPSAFDSVPEDISIL